MVEAAEQAITIVDEEYRGQIRKTTNDLKDACQLLVNSAYQQCSITEAANLNQNQ